MTTPKLKVAIDALLLAADELNALQAGAAATEYAEPIQNMGRAIAQMKEAMKTERFTEEGQDAMAAAMAAQQDVVAKLLGIANPDKTRTNAK
jgi:hypothetical protein